MKKTAILVISSLFLLATIFTSCEATKNANNTQKGAGIGAAAGALIGGIIGNNSKIGTAGGALIGAAIGGGSGALIGNKWTNKLEKLTKHYQEQMWKELEKEFVWY